MTNRAATTNPQQAGSGETGLDIKHLDALVSHYFRESLAPSTRRSYRSAKIRYLDFCTNTHIKPLPTTERNLCMFASYLAHTGIAHQTIKSYLSAIKHLQIEAGLGVPNISSMPVLEHVVRGIKKECSKSSPGSKPRLPITPGILMKLREVWEENATAFDNIMMWATCCTCYFGFLRSGEMCSIGRERRL